MPVSVQALVQSDYLPLKSFTTLGQPHVRLLDIKITQIEIEFTRQLSQ